MLRAQLASGKPGSLWKLGVGRLLKGLRLGTLPAPQRAQHLDRVGEGGTGQVQGSRELLIAGALVAVQGALRGHR